MSTKIYNAFLFNGSSEELIKILKEIKDYYYKLLEETLPKLNFKKWKLQKSRYPFLDFDMSWEEFKELDFSEYLLEDIMEKEKKRGEYHPLNIDASSVIYFYKEKIYVQFFGLPRTFQEIILNKYVDKFKDFHYQNSTDQSNYDWNNEKWDEMSEERQNELENDWNDRYNIWENILPDWSAPSDCGLSFKFTPHNYEMTQLCKKILESV